MLILVMKTMIKQSISVMIGQVILITETTWIISLTSDLGDIVVLKMVAGDMIRMGW